MQNIAIILSGGTGERMKSCCPKQYLMVNGKPIITYTLSTFAGEQSISKIVVVAEAEWQPFIKEQVELIGVKQTVTFAEPGSSRQHSVLNALKLLAEQNTNKNDIILVHDAVRPLVSQNIIRQAIEACSDHDGALPVVTVKDTIYQSFDGKTANHLLRRNELFAGQSPESLLFGKFYDIHKNLSEHELAAVTGCTMLAIKKGLKIALIQGAESNFKITTKEDLLLFELLTR